jgi:hypothetical protein
LTGVYGLEAEPLGNLPPKIKSDGPQKMAKKVMEDKKIDQLA